MFVQLNPIDTVAAERGVKTSDLSKIVEMTVTNVASHSFGIVAMDDSDGAPKEYISNLVLAQDPVPATESRAYGTVVANQTHVDLRIMENTERTGYVDIDRGRSIGLARSR